MFRSRRADFRVVGDVGVKCRHKKVWKAEEVATGRFLRGQRRDERDNQTKRKRKKERDREGEIREIQRSTGVPIAIVSFREPEQS